MKRSDTSFISGRSSNSLKLILKVGTASPSDSERTQDVSLHSDSFSNMSNENSLNSIHTYVSSSRKQHKKSKKKKKKKHKEHRHRHKSKKKHFYEISHRVVEEDLFPDLMSTNDSVTNDTTIPDASFRLPTNVEIKSEPNKTPLQKLLDYIQHIIESKDTRRFFAWPVTDQIAPGYFNVISNPMDLNTMRCKIDYGDYKSLVDYVEDFKLMCQNAMIYNHPETIYFKTAKKLLHAGLKITSLEKIRALQSDLPYIKELTYAQLGFYLNPAQEVFDTEEKCVDVKLEQFEEGNDDTSNIPDEVDASVEEQETDNSLTAEEILSQVHEASKKISEKASHKNSKNEVGYLRQNDDGTTTLSILIPTSGIDRNKKERPILLGALVGKLSHGNSNWHAFREDKRNIVKPVKPLNYGSYGSYAPSYDSTFSNLTKDETDLLFQTYGNEPAIQYAESVLNFSKDNDYTTVMVDNLLDIMTSGEHRKTKKLLEEKKRLREETNIDNKAKKLAAAVTSTSSIENEMKPELSCLKTLSELGIDTSFVDYYEDLWKEQEAVRNKLVHTRALIEKLHQMQNERLSSTMPMHLSNVASVTEVENQLADRVTESLMHIIKKVPPGIVTSVSEIRKALGIAPQSDATSKSINLNPNNTMITNDTATSVTTNTNKTITTPIISTATNDTLIATNQVTEDGHKSGQSCTSYVTGIDLETELREFLENDSELSNFELPDDDRTIEQMLSGS